MPMIDQKLLIKKAMEARLNAYAPYSNYGVGACVLCEDGTIYTGCNIENASYGATNCAERTAIFKAVSDNKLKLVAIAVCGGPLRDDNQNLIKECLDYAYPCGICRQVMREFSNPDTFEVYVAKSTEDYQTFLLEELLPKSFGPENLE